MLDPAGCPCVDLRKGLHRMFLGCSAAPPTDGTQGPQLPADFMESQVSMGHGLRDPRVIPSQLYVHCPMATLSPHRWLQSLPGLLEKQPHHGRGWEGWGWGGWQRYLGTSEGWVVIRDNRGFSVIKDSQHN